MLQRIANFLRGWAELELELEGGNVEELFNRLSLQNVPFWDIKKEKPNLWSCKVGYFHHKTALLYAAKQDCVGRVKGWGGVGGTCRMLAGRWGFWGGLLSALVLVGWGGNVVWRVEVTGNAAVPTGRILTQLKAQGVKVGAFAPTIDPRDAAQGVLLEIPELSWLSINLNGTVAQVVVREGRSRPELLEEDIPARVVAKYAGIVTRVRPTTGDAKVQKGDTVVAGDVLIDQWVDFVEPEGYAGDMGGMTVRATGQVWARTWHTLKAAMPLTQTEKRYTGREKRQVSLEFLGKELKFYRKGGIPYGKYDKIATYYRLSMPFGIELPIAWKVVTLREYLPEETAIDPDTAAEELTERLLRRLSALAEETEIRKTDCAVEQGQGLLTVTLLAECEQQIGITEESADESEGKTR